MAGPTAHRSPMLVKPIAQLVDPCLRLEGTAVDSSGEALWELLDDLDDTIVATRPAAAPGPAEPSKRASSRTKSMTSRGLDQSSVVRRRRDPQGCRSSRATSNGCLTPPRRSWGRRRKLWASTSRSPAPGSGPHSSYGPPPRRRHPHIDSHPPLMISSSRLAAARATTTTCGRRRSLADAVTRQFLG